MVRHRSSLRDLFFFGFPPQRCRAGLSWVVPAGLGFANGVTSVVPPGLVLLWLSSPALSRWAKLGRPCGTRFRKWCDIGRPSGTCSSLAFLPSAVALG